MITRWKDDLRLFLNAHLQFSSRDEYRYHEALVHPGLSALPNARRALVLGGGDGLAVRELLKYPNLESITLVDLDPEMTEAVHRTSDARAAERLFVPQSARACHQRRRVSRGSITNQGSWDFVVVDFPDPTNYSLGKLYTTTFYRLLQASTCAKTAWWWFRARRRCSLANLTGASWIR